MKKIDTNKNGKISDKEILAIRKEYSECGETAPQPAEATPATSIDAGGTASADPVVKKKLEETISNLKKLKNIANKNSEKRLISSEYRKNLRQNMSRLAGIITEEKTAGTEEASIAGKLLIANYDFYTEHSSERGGA